MNIIHLLKELWGLGITLYVESGRLQWRTDRPQSRQTLDVMKYHREALFEAVDMEHWRHETWNAAQHHGFPSVELCDAGEETWGTFVGVADRELLIEAIGCLADIEVPELVERKAAA